MKIKKEIIQKKIIKFIFKRNLNYQKVKKIRFLDEGLIDSLSIIKLIIFIETNFKIKLSSKDTESDDFRHIEGLVKLIAKKINE